MLQDAPDRPKLLVLTSTFPRWQGDSCPTFVSDLSVGLTEWFDVTVLAPGSRSAKSREPWNGASVRRYTYAWPASSQRLADGAILPNLRRNKLLFGLVPSFVLAQLWSAWQLARHETFDAIHAHWALPQGWVAGALKKTLGIPALTTTHGGDMYALKDGLPLRAKRWAMRQSDRVAAVSTSLKTELLALGVDEERVRILPMGVDTRRFRSDAASVPLRRQLSPQGPLLLFVGRLVEKKGARYAIQSMHHLRRTLPDAVLAIVGDGPERATLERLVEELDLRERVRFLGATPHSELPAIFASADLFVGPSVVENNGDTDSFGVVYAEAMASGCPVIATDVGGVSDVVLDGETGTLVPQRDSLAIADAAQDLLANDARRERMLANGQAWVRERFDLRKTTAGYADVLNEMVAA